MAARRRIVFDTDEVVRSLYFAATSGDVKQLKSLIQKGADVNSFIHDGSSGVNKLKNYSRSQLHISHFALRRMAGVSARGGVSAREGCICQTGVCLPGGCVYQGVSARVGGVCQEGGCLLQCILG